MLEAQPQQNHLLAALPAAEAQRWLPTMETVDMPLGSVLYESGGALSHVYFPTTAIVSLLYVMENGSSAEIAVVGNEESMPILWKSNRLAKLIGLPTSQ